MSDQFLLFLLLKISMLYLTQLQLFIEVGGQILYFFNFRPHLDLYHHQLSNPNINSLQRLSISIEILKALTDLTMLHIVEIIHPLHKVTDLDGYLGEEALRG